MEDMNSTEQLKLTRDLILKKFHPDQYESEQLAKQKKLADLLAFVEGVVSQHNLQKEEDKVQKENNILFRSEDSPSKKRAELENLINKLSGSKK
ncbi:hypothetical protein ABE458_27415 [Pseudomonas protegens]|uniref:hypothetical protein n=1 Tax=Pseudomonas protegens TaxID=380021 RepID=UPI0032081B03